MMVSDKILIKLFKVMKNLLRLSFFGLLFLFISFSAKACYTVVAGKKATVDGAVLFAHNEDDGSRRLFNLWQVPGQSHQSGERVMFTHGGSIPQVAETWGFSWIESVDQNFSDFYMNEWGVTLASNACGSKVQDAELTDGGIGFMLRRIVAQRAKTAREGVEIAGRLLDRFGYASQGSTGRTLVIADKNEAWLMDILPGKYWVAERVPDDAVVLQPNIYVIRSVDFKDTANFITSKKDIRKYAMKHHWYHPKKNKVFDFSYIFSDFRAPHFAERGYDTRQWRGQEIISGKKITVAEAKKSGLPFSVKPNHKLKPADLMRLLRDHYEGTVYDVSQDRKGNPNSSNERTICYKTTQVSLVAQLRPDMPKEMGAVLWLSFGRPDVNTYIPFYPFATKIPATYHFVPGGGGWEQSLAHHFDPLPGTFAYQPHRAFWIFNDLENISGLNYYRTIDSIQKVWKSMEQEAIGLQPAIEQTALQLYKTDPEAARNYLQSISDARVFTALKTTKKLTNKVKGMVYR
jgi:dipeptidase